MTLQGRPPCLGYAHLRQRFAWLLASWRVGLMSRVSAMSSCTICLQTCRVTCTALVVLRVQGAQVSSRAWWNPKLKLGAFESFTP